jgi:RNA polymerase sigma-70 factor (ECF subfamily)
MAYHDPEERRRQFEAVALPFMQALYNTALRLTSDAEDAADSVQETYLRAFRTFDNFRPGTNAKAWLFTILYSVVINRRKKARREVGPLPVEELEARYRQFVEAQDADASELDLEVGQWPREVESALRALPEAFRDAVLLVDVQELTYEEAAVVLGCPMGTVQSRVFRGRRMLFGALRDYARRAGYLPPETP